MEAEVGVLLSPVKEDLEAEWLCQQPDFRFLAFRTKIIHFCCFKLHRQFMAALEINMLEL
jgi:hypothetical protein